MVFEGTDRSVITRPKTLDCKDRLYEKGSIVLDCLIDNPHAKLSEVAETTGMSISTVKKTVSMLEKEGFLANEGTNRNSVRVVR